MSHKKMLGFVDPITLGILIVLSGTTIGLTQNKPAEKPVAVSAAASTAQTPSPAVAPMAQTKRATTN